MKITLFSFFFMNFILAATTSAQSAAQNKLTKPTTNDALVKQLLAEDLGTRSFLFSQVVKSSTGHDVLAFDKESQAHQSILAAIQKAIKESIITLNQANSPIKKLRRINEASRYFEELVLEKLAADPNLNCTIPKNTQGKAQRSGYPDMRIEHIASKTVFYLDPKLFEKKSRASSLRTFYFAPKTRTMKIQDDAVHLLLGISHDGVDGDWTFLNWELVDLSKFKVRLKAEFQASNKDLYRKGNIIGSGE
jgi:hypothetical protein